MVRLRRQFFLKLLSESAVPGVLPCSPIEEGIPHEWIGGLVVQPLDWGGGEGAGFKNCERRGACSWCHRDDLPIFGIAPSAGFGGWRLAFCLQISWFSTRTSIWGLAGYES